MVARYVMSIDQGTTSTRCILFDQRRPPGLGDPARAQAALPEARLGRARRRWRSGATSSGSPPRRCRQAGVDRRPGRRARHRQPARDHGAVGPAHRPPDRPRHRLAGHPHRRSWSTELRARARTPRSSTSARGLPLATYFSAPRHPLDARPHPRPARAGRARRRAVRHDGELADLEPDRRPGRRRARHRRHQRQPHAADEPRTLRLGRRSCWTSSACRAAMLPRDPARRPRSTARRARVLPGVRIARRARRPAGGAVRPDLLRAAARPSAPTAPAASCC